MTDLLIPSRRGLLKAAAGIIAFPALVRAESLMKISALAPAFEWGQSSMMEVFEAMRKAMADAWLYGAAPTENTFLGLSGIPHRLRAPDTTEITLPRPVRPPSPLEHSAGSNWPG